MPLSAGGARGFGRPAITAILASFNSNVRERTSKGFERAKPKAIPRRNVKCSCHRTSLRYARHESNYTFRAALNPVADVLRCPGGQRTEAFAYSCVHLCYAAMWHRADAQVSCGAEQP